MFVHERSELGFQSRRVRAHVPARARVLLRCAVASHPRSLWFFAFSACNRSSHSSFKASLLLTSSSRSCCHRSCLLGKVWIVRLPLIQRLRRPQHQRVPLRVHQARERRDGDDARGRNPAPPRPRRLASSPRRRPPRRPPPPPSPLARNASAIVLHHRPMFDRRHPPTSSRAPRETATPPSRSDSRIPTRNAIASANAPLSLSASPAPRRRIVPSPFVPRPASRASRRRDARRSNRARARVSRVASSRVVARARPRRRAPSSPAPIAIAIVIVVVVARASSVVVARVGAATRGYRVEARSSSARARRARVARRRVAMSRGRSSPRWNRRRPTARLPGVRVRTPGYAREVSSLL